MNIKIIFASGIITLLIAIGLTAVSVEEKIDEHETISCEELINDLEQIGNVSSLTSYQPGNLLYLKDRIFDVSYCKANENFYTIIILDGYRAPGFQLCFKGDKRPDYTEGVTYIIPVHVEKYNIEGEDVIWLEEWYNSYNIEDYFSDLR